MADARGTRLKDEAEYGRMSGVKRAIRRILAWFAAAVVVAAIAVPFAAPPIITRLVEAKLAAYGLPAKAKMTLGYGWRGGPELAGTFRLSLVDAPWRLAADFGSGFGQYHAAVRLPETDFTEADPALARLLDLYRPLTISNVAFSGSVSLDASVERTRQFPVPVWNARAPIRIDAAQAFVGPMPVALGGFVAEPKASGLADHVDVAPLFLRAQKVDVGTFSFTNLFASVHATEKTLLVTEARAGFCGGTASLYALVLDPKSLDAGLTLFLDGIDAGAALDHVKGFRGDATGRLHGKARLFVREGGKSVRLGDAFLYSTPGEGGRLRLENAETFTDTLALAGLDEATRGNVANALSDLDYKVLKLDLRRARDASASLGLGIQGTATRGDTTVPVDIRVNLHGAIEQLLNTGLGYQQKLKGMTK